MPVLRTVQCDVCGATCTEKTQNDGWNGWGNIGGIVLNGVATPHLCPEHLHAVAEFVDSLVEKQNDLD